MSDVSEDRKLIERIAAMLHEPVELPEGCPSLGERIIAAIDMLYRENHDLRNSEYDLIVLQRAWAPVVQSAATQAQNAREMRAESARDTSAGPAYTTTHFARWERQCRDTERLVEGLTDEQREASKP